MASGAYGPGLRDIQKGLIDLDSDTLKCLLVQTSYTFDPDHDFVDDITGGANYELNSGGGGSGYVAGYSGSGRKTLASLAVTYSTGNNRTEFDFADLQWTSINAGTARALVIYRHTGSSADSDAKLLFYIQFPSDVVTNGGNLDVVVDSTGCVRIACQ